MNDYKLMPEEATPEMLAAGEYALEAGCYVSGIYADMRAAAPDVQVDPVGYIRKQALELMKSAELGVRANIIKEPRYRDCVAIYTTPQTAEKQPDRDVRALAAALYQACGAYDMPTRVLDVLSAVANGLSFAHMIDGLLPCVPPSNQNVQGETVAWSGWGCQYPGKMPRLYGERRIAELNCDWENGDQVLHFTATSPHTDIQEKNHENQ